MLDFLFNLIVKPLHMLFEFIFANTYLATENIALSIFILSFIVSLLCLPLYLRADEIQEEENEVQKKLAKRVNSIKKNFKGDERALLLQAYYRQNNYHPIMGLRLSLSLLLQIPIFMAAYSYFNDLSLLEGLSFLGIKNLSAPDNLIQIFGLKINGLPILMTLVSLLASVIYSNFKSLKDGWALIIVNLIFLVVLYNSPSGLVLYWLFNNLFSLMKNFCLLKISRENLVKYSFAFGLIFYCVLYKIFKLPLDIIVFILAGVILFNHPKVKNLNLNFGYKKMFILSAAALWMVLGLFIPSNIISTSPSEFSFQDCSPIGILLWTGTFFAGLILFWGSWIYYFSNKKFKKILALGACSTLMFAITNLYLLKIPLSILTNTLQFATPDVEPFSYSKLQIAIYLTITFLVCIFIFREIFKKRRTKILNAIVLIVLISTSLLSVYNFSKIATSHFALIKEEKETNKYDKYIKLSNNQKNVIIIFVDRAIGAYIPTIFKENPNLKEKYQGFTYYPNTLSYAGYTLLSYPALIGGYEYTPIEMNKSDKVFEVKYKEALTVLTKIFAGENWETTVINPMGTEWEGSLKDGVRRKDIKALDESSLYKNSKTRHIKIPNSIIYNTAKEKKLKIADSSHTKRNLAYFSILSVISPDARKHLYDKGNYHNTLSKEGQDKAIKDKFFLKNYAELLRLSEFTTFSQDNNTFTIFNNALPHFHTDIDCSNYEISNEILSSNIGMSEWRLQNYISNRETIKLIGEYLDFLKLNNVYDNTRIIIVADHGYIDINLSKSPKDNFEMKQITPFNPLLMVKDFNSQNEFRDSQELMTNADVPTLATSDIIQNPKNPYTQKEINSAPKKEGVAIIREYNWKPEFYLGKKRILNKKDSFNFVQGDPSVYRNWRIDLTLDEIKEYSSKIAR